MTIIYMVEEKTIKFFDDKTLDYIKTKFSVKKYKEAIADVKRVDEEDMPKYIRQIYRINSEHFDYFENIEIFKRIKKLRELINEKGKLNNININANLKKFLLERKCIFRKINGFNICTIPKGTYLFKGMQYFYDIEYEKKYIKETKINEIWVGDIFIASSYADRYQGGLNAYVVKEDINLLISTNYDNIKKIYDMLETEDERKAFCIKYGVCDVAKQIRYILDLEKYGDEIWINNEITVPETGEYFYDKRLRFYGTGYNDRMVSRIIQKYIGNKINGWITFKAITPYTYHGKFPEEILLFDYNKLERDESSIFDWVQWKDELPIKITDDFMLSESFLKKNNNFRFTKFYQNNTYNGAPKQNCNLKFLTFNVHFFASINKYDSSDKCYNNFIKLLKDVDADVIGIQEYPIEFINRLKQTEYNILYTSNGSYDNSLNCVLITKHKIDKYDIIKDKEYKKFRNSLYAVIDINGKKISVINTHLPIGKRYSRDETLVYENIIKTYNGNVKERIRFLDRLVKYNPDVMMGDMNFSPIDLEAKYIEKTKYSKSLKKNGEIKFSVPYDILVDYILVNDNKNNKNNNNKNNITYKTIPYQYSDHLPLMMCMKL